MAAEVTLQEGARLLVDRIILSAPEDRERITYLCLLAVKRVAYQELLAAASVLESVGSHLCWARIQAGLAGIERDIRDGGGTL
jgi:hypothetical protein